MYRGGAELGGLKRPSSSAFVEGGYGPSHERASAENHFGQLRAQGVSRVLAPTTGAATRSRWTPATGRTIYASPTFEDRFPEMRETWRRRQAGFPVAENGS
jgi:hypothetical protein